jgi:replicative DNA helicase
MSSQDKLVPHNEDAEENVNGSLLIDGKLFTELIGEVDSSDFFSEYNRWIFSACESLYKTNVSIDQITVANELEMKGLLVKMGGAAYLNHLISITVTSFDIVYYARIVRDHSNRRKLITATDKISEMAYGDLPLNEAII